VKKDAIASEEKADARSLTMMRKQEEMTGLLKVIVVAKKRERDLALLMDDTSTMDVDTREWYNEQHAMIFQERSATATPATNVLQRRRTLLHRQGTPHQR
jgi:hypothetical protein